MFRTIYVTPGWMVAFPGTESKPEALFRENFKWSVNSGNFCLRFWPLQCQQFRFSMLKKPACKVPQDFKIVWVFFNSLFFLRIRIEGKESFHQGDHNLVFIRHKTWSLNAFPPLRACFIEWLSSRTFTLQFEGNMDAAVSFSRKKASVGSCWWRCQDGLERFPVAHTTFQEIGSQEHHGW